MEILIIFVVVCAFLAHSVAPEDKKNLGFVLGLVLGPIGVLVAVLLKPDPDAATRKPMGKLTKIGIGISVVVIVLVATSYRP